MVPNNIDINLYDVWWNNLIDIFNVSKSSNRAKVLGYAVKQLGSVVSPDKITQNNGKLKLLGNINIPISKLQLIKLDLNTVVTNLINNPFFTDEKIESENSDTVLAMERKTFFPEMTSLFSYMFNGKDGIPILGTSKFTYNNARLKVYENKDDITTSNQLISDDFNDTGTILLQGINQDQDYYEK